MSTRPTPKYGLIIEVGRRRRRRVDWACAAIWTAAAILVITFWAVAVVLAAEVAR